MDVFLFDLQNITPEIALHVLGHNPYTFFLDGHDKKHPLSQFSFIGYNPEIILTPDPHNFSLLNVALDQFKPKNIDDFSHIPFIGGLIGYMHYESGYICNDMSLPFQPETNTPPILFGLYTKTIIFDWATGKNYLSIITDTSEQAAQILQNLLDKIKTHSYKKILNSSVKFLPVESKSSYKKKIQTVINYIKNGDIFQANLSQDLIADCPNNFCPVTQYLRMRTLNPAPFSMFLNLSTSYILSSSPERFIKLRNKTIETRPIKGTISDSEFPEILQTNPKNRAENIMIVDLMRNDFSKICDDQSVTVDALCAIETFKGLHHLVSIISGWLRTDKTIFDALNACFPGGSITGAPKNRAMEIIAELEGRPRGMYCGSIGYIGFDGNADFNISIRTVVIADKKIHVSVGGGITAQSNPDDEYDETMLKAQKIIESFL